MPLSLQNNLLDCTGIILFFVILDRSGWTVRTICTRISAF
ncbi:TraK (plasmid) [Escherichia coli]|nr:TraK [Escherichia coli]